MLTADSAGCGGAGPHVGLRGPCGARGVTGRHLRPRAPVLDDTDAGHAATSPEVKDAAFFGPTLLAMHCVSSWFLFNYLLVLIDCTESASARESSVA